MEKELDGLKNEILRVAKEMEEEANVIDSDINGPAREGRETEEYFASVLHRRARELKGLIKDKETITSEQVGKVEDVL